MKTKIFLSFLLLFSAVPFFLPCFSSAAEEGQTAAADSSDDYGVAKVNLDGVEVLEKTDGSVDFRLKNQWVHWVMRGASVVCFDIALMFLLMFLPKKENFLMAFMYVVSGASFMLCFWVFSCAVVIARQNIPAAAVCLGVSALMYVWLFLNMRRLRVADAALAANINKLNSGEDEAEIDQRLAKIDCTPSNWPDSDFMK